VLQVWPNMAGIQQAIGRSRYQSFFLALVLDALILAAVYMLVRYTRHARELAEEQMKFVAATSHELRTPLTVIRGAAHNLERGIVTEPTAVREYAAMITHNAEQLSGMIEQVLAFATLRQTSHQLDRKPTDLRNVLRQAFAPLSGEMESSRVAFELNLPSVPAQALAEEKSLARAFQNLATNALKHGGAGGWVRAGLRRISEGREAEITITDGGPGIPAEERDRIFEPFFRGAAATAEQTRGSGIGLSLVREIVHAHGGTVEAGSPDRGAEFIVRLPLITPPA
jgi:signal transduction histidine kinase